MAEVSLRGVKKQFGATQVIHGVDCEIEDGEFVVIVGPSGCGKSTLLRMIAGLEEVSSGDIAIAGKVVNTVEPKDRNIAMVFQNYALYPHMSVYENMAYGLKIRGLPKTEIRERVDRAAGILQIEALLERRPRQLSGGQRQRVAMGRAIVRDPAVFLFDEPLSNLDAKLRVQMRVEIRKLHQTLRTTSVYVTHDQVEAMTLADRLIVMNAGRVEQIGTPITLYEDPATLFVAGFLGSPAMNFLSGSVSADGRSVALPGGVTAPLAATHGAAAGRPVTVGIRPEHLDLAGDAPPTATIKVDLVELLGADTIVHGRIGDGGLLLARIDGAVPIRTGESLPVVLAPNAVHLFDPGTGARI
ncbi:sn-glycerol-3-phosphate import ATP-binding protein UgpC [Allostella vacuolata]|nr:sn-glycerol-3-phosphate import ATP-binding protein UgpC [Stella vacuolata]